MKYTDSRNNIQFNKVQQPGVYHASGPIGLNGRYSTNGDNITGISSEMNLINAIDINWNGAKVESDLEINTTGDLLRWIKSKSSSGGAVDISINDAGYWCVNGVSLGVKARGENGLTPYIGPNGNWWIGTTDLGVAASSSSILENNVTYTSNYISSSTTYLLGVLRVGNREYPIIGKNTGSGGDSSSTTNIIQTLSNNISYTPQVTNATSGSYAIGTFNIGNKAPITLYGINTTSDSSTTLNITNIVNLQLANSISYIPTVGYSTEGSYEIGKLKIGNNSPVTIYGKDIAGNSNIGGSLNQPLASINILNRNPSSNNSLLLYNNGWGYKTLNEVGESIKQYFTGNNYWSIGSEPDEYLKRVSSSGDTLIFTKKDGSTWSYTPSGTSEGGGDTVSVPYAYGLGEGRIKIASIKINDNPNVDIYAPLGGGGEGGVEYVENPYDDSWILGAIDDAVDQLDHDLSSALLLLRTDLDNILDDRRDDINQMINDIINGKNFVDGWQAGWDDNLKSYLISVGVLGANGVDKGWAYLDVQYNLISADVQSLRSIIGDNGEINLEALRSELKLYTDNKVSTAIAELTANYALTDEDLEVIKWLSAGLHSEASANKALTEVFATAEQYNTLSDLLTQTLSGVSGLTTEVTNIKNNYVARTSLGSMVKEVIRDNEGNALSLIISSSGLVTLNDINSAVSSLSSSISNTYATKNSLNSYATTAALAGVSSEVTNIKNNYVAKTSLGSEIKTTIDNDGTVVSKIISSGGIVTTSTMDSACATVFAQNGNAKAGIVAAVKNNKSSLGLTANDITIDSSHKLNLTSSNCSISSDLLNIDADTLIANLDTGSISADKINFTTGEYTIDASHINLNGTVLFNYVGDEFENKGIKIDNNEINIGWYMEGDHKNLILNKDYVTLISEMDYRDRVYIDSGQIIVETYNESYPTNIYAGRIRTGTFEAIEDVIVNNELSFIPSGYMTASAHIYAVLGGLQIDSSETIGMDGNVSIDGDFTVYGTTKVSRGHVLFSEVGSGGGSGMLISGLSGYGINCDTNLGITGTLTLAFYSNGQITANKTISTSSDIRQKDIQSYVDVSVESISNIPIFYYTWKEIENSREYLGTSALDVLEIFPLAVTTTLDDTLALDYSPVALASAVITAREVVTLKEKVLTLEEENQSLKERLANIEATLERINTALG